MLKNEPSLTLKVAPDTNQGLQNDTNEKIKQQKRFQKQV